MKITVTTSKGFLHGRMKFEEGKTYEVEDKFGGYFLGMGWAQEAKFDAKSTSFDVKKMGIDAPPTRKGNTLEVQDIEKRVGSPKAGGKE